MEKSYRIFYFLFFILAGIASTTLHAQKNPPVINIPFCTCHLNASVTASVSCNGGSDGIATANGGKVGTDCSGTTGTDFNDADYSWNSSPVQNTKTATSLPAGVYVVSWDDGSGDCALFTRTVTITEPSAILATINSNPEICGQNNGTAAVSGVSGGAGSYSYSWTFNGNPVPPTTASISGLTSGTYACTIHDASGCSKVFSTNVGSGGTPTNASNTSGFAALCSSGNTGSASVFPTGGGGSPYTYSWAPSGGNAQTANNLAGGITYTVTVTGSNGCMDKGTFYVGLPMPIGYNTFTKSSEICGNGKGSISINGVGGGTPGYSYLWSPSGQTGPNAVNLSAGPYSVTVTDANSCTAVFSTTLSNTNVTLNPSISSHVDVLCRGGNTGSATADASVSGGVPPYSYAWSPFGGNAATANSLSAGLYSVIVTDVNGCTGSASVNIGEPSSSINVPIPTTTAANCGTNNGSAQANPTGGTGSYTYQWSPSGGNAQTANNLYAGTYSVTVWDNNGCSASNSASVSSSSGITATANVVTNVSCFGGSNGSATVSASSSNPPYTFSWSPSGGTNSTASNLTAGIYNVTVRDQMGCVVISNNITITQPTAITSNVTTTPAKCGLPVGTASANASGGTGSLTYAWSPSGGNAATANNLAAGNYTVTVTDSKGCTKIKSGTVISTPAVAANISSQTNVLCNGGNNGAATVTVTVGSPVYTYSWLPSGGNAQTANNLIAGNYSVTVTDNYGCTKTVTISITQPTALTTTNIITNPTSCAVNNGTATETPSGGTGTYTYSWNTFPVQTAATATGLGTGNYTVTVKDANNCSKTATTTITYSTSVSANISSTTSITCNGGNNGAATATVTVGSSPFLYLWNTTPVQTTQTATGLTSGNYTVIVTDNLSCIKTVTVNINQPTAITAVLSTTATACGTSNGVASAAASGGTGALTYSWSIVPVQTSSLATGLSSGIYTVTVTDANNCTKTFTPLVTNIGGPNVSVSPIVNVTCYGGNNGSAKANANAGTPPYLYSWNTAPAQTAQTATGLAAGNYLVMVTDASVCITSQTLAVTQPAQIDPHIANSSISICKGSQAPIFTNATGGNPGGYTYNWVPAGDLDDGTLANPVAGPIVTTTYTVTVTDSKGCKGTGTVTVTVHNLPAINAGLPSIIICTGGSTTLNATSNPAGATYVWSPSTNLSNTTIANPVATPTAVITYTVIGTDSLGCSNSDSIHIQFAPTLTVSIASSASTVCSGSSVTLNASTNASFYSWSTGQSTSSVTVVPSATATYSLTVTSGSCSKTSTVTITTNPTPVAAISGNAVLCIGKSETLLALGGTNYSWNTGVTTSSINISPTSTTSYSVIVTSPSSGSCFGVATLSVTVALLPTITTAATYSTICVGSSVDTLIATGGTIYSWSPGGGTTSSIAVSFGTTGLTTYTVTVTNSSGCSKISTLAINATNGFNPPQVFSTTSLTVCVGDPVPTFTATPNPTTNGIGWTDPANSFTAIGDTFTPPQNLSPGTHIYYCVQGTGTSCLSPATVINIIVNPLPTAVAGKNVTICPGYSAQLSASGGTSYLWSPTTALNTPSISNPVAESQLTTTYEVIVGDASNCRAKDSVTVYVVLNDTCLIIIYNLISPNGDDKNDVWWIDGIKFFPDNTVRIFNRWGAKVWEGSPYDNDKIIWKGQNQNGAKLPDGTYYYIIELGNKTMSGFVELVH